MSFLLWLSSALGTKSKFTQYPFAQSGSITGLTKLLSSVDHIQPLAQAGPPAGAAVALPQFGGPTWGPELYLDSFHPMENSG